MATRLIINADDFGAAPEIDEAIRDLITAGALRDVSVLANGPTVEPALEWLRSHPEVSVGVHLNAVEFKPLSDVREVACLVDGDGYFVGLTELLLRWGRSPARVTRALAIEWERQIRRLVDAGLCITHLDSHRHVHALPGGWRIALELSRDWRIPALRLPKEPLGLRARPFGSLALRSAQCLGRLVSSSPPILHNDHFLGFRRAGEYTLPALRTDLRNLTSGVTELALHPSLVDHRPYPAMRGDGERRLLLDPQLPSLLASLGIERMTWRDLLDPAS